MKQSKRLATMQVALFLSFLFLGWGVLWQLKWGEPIARAVVTLDTSSYTVQAQLSRRWILVGDSLPINPIDNKMSVVAKVTPSLPPDCQLIYQVSGTQIEGVLTKNIDNTYSSQIETDNLGLGSYVVQIGIKQGGGETKVVSEAGSFNLSAPLFVTWTLDWEGWDVSDEWLDGMASLADEYQIPLTHFFNPYIYVEGTFSQYRANQLTSWMKKRVEQGDEVGLHLHMWDAIVKAAGIKPRSDIRAPWLSGYKNGGDVPTYAYTKAEVAQILSWSKQKFSENGLPVPISFRAGGWLIQEHALQALAESGFLIDSSGRTDPATDTQTTKMKSLPADWHLQITTRPYRPSVLDQNSSALPSLDIWEFPNNGGDAYWYSAQDMINRFDANFPDQNVSLLKPQVVTFLSHPQFWGTTDRSKLVELWKYVNQFSFAGDNGPVVFTTLAEASVTWK